MRSTITALEHLASIRLLSRPKTGVRHGNDFYLCYPEAVVCDFISPPVIRLHSGPVHIGPGSDKDPGKVTGQAMSGGLQGKLTEHRIQLFFQALFYKTGAVTADCGYIESLAQLIEGSGTALDCQIDFPVTYCVAHTYVHG